MPLPENESLRGCPVRLSMSFSISPTTRRPPGAFRGSPGTWQLVIDPANNTILHFRFDVGSPAELTRCAGSNGTTSVAIGTLQLEVGVATKRLLFAWGLHPRTARVTDRLDPPCRLEGEVFIYPDRPLLAGVTIMVAPVGVWRTRYDLENGWIRIEADERADDERLEIASSVVIGSNNDTLHSIWLQPAFE
jgi:hypothetical protein